MLPTYQTNTDVTLAIDYPMDGASVVSPATVDYEVFDEAGSVVFAKAPVPGAAAVTPTLTLTIDHSLNVVPDGSIRALRTVRAYFTTSDGAVLISNTRYTLEVADKLQVMGNSFQTYETALLTRLDMPALDGWDMTDEPAQIGALITAHDRMCRLLYRYRISQEALEWDSVQANWGMYRYVTDMRLRDMDDYAQFPADFKIALNRAQVYEADTILAGDPVGDKRAQGIVSETTGEAKMFFSTKPPLRHPIGPNALNVLASYITRNNRLTRA